MKVNSRGTPALETRTGAALVRRMACFGLDRILPAAALMSVVIVGTGWCAEPAKTPFTGAARSIEEVSFISGDLVFPEEGTNNNHGVLLQQTVPGITHIESYARWGGLEPQKDVWNLKDFDEMLRLCEEHHVKLLVLPWIMTAPDWFKKAPGYAPLTDMQTGVQADYLSPWAPATLVAFDHFYQAMASHYKDRISIIKLGCAGSTFGEVGLSINDHPYPCGDPYARADFKKRMLEKYGELNRLNAAWGTSFANDSAIDFPDPEHHAAQRRRWVDFISWIQESQVRNMVAYLQIIRKYFPATMLDIPLGFGSDLARDGCDRTAICRAASDFKPVTVRSTHGSFNRGNPPLAYWFYKRMAPMCHHLGIGFGTEPPGGDLTRDELRRQYFEDASAGVSYIFHYYQNYHLTPDVVGDYKRILRPQEQSLVDIGVLYPSTQMILDMTFFPEGQPQFCDSGREHFDYDLVDENMIGWGMLDGYKVLLHTTGKVFREPTLSALGRWLEKGGILVTRGTPQWEDLDGKTGVAAAWLANEETAAAMPGARVYRIGKGRLYAVAADKIADYLPKVVEILARSAKAQPANALLNGFNGKDDHKFVTDFPSGRLGFDTKTLATEFVPKVPAPVTGVARSVNEVPFISGAMTFPVWKNFNNRGVITDQYLPGMTHIEGCINWRYFEPEKDRWDTKELDAILPLLRERNLKLSVLPFLMYPPEWFKKTVDYTPLVNMKTGQAADSLSPWAPGTAAAFDHFFEGLARLFKDKIDIIKLGYPGTDFGEVGLGIGGNGFLLSINPDTPFPQDPAAWKEGYWCGDRFARADFHERMLAKYGDIDRLNARWGTRFANAEAIEFPDPDKRTGQDRRWVDFISWIHESQVRNLAVYLRVIRKHFPHTMLDVPMGFGSDSANLGCDRTAVCRAAADFKPVTIRSTHGSFNREGWPRAYWFYKRMGPVAHRMGIGFGTEPPGGDVTKDEMRRQMFEDASAGMNYIFHYYQNYHAFPDVIGEYKRLLRPQEQSLVDIGVLFPTTQMMIDLAPFPEGQIQLCRDGREYFDYDLVDENMIGWGMLDGYKVLLHTTGKVFREPTLPALGRWLEKGGILVTRGMPQWEDLDGNRAIAAAWLANEETAAVLPGVRVYRIGKGRLYAVAADKIADYLPKVVEVLARTAKAQPANAPLNGFDGKDDHQYVTDFPSGRLVFDTKTLATEFVPKATP